MALRPEHDSNHTRDPKHVKRRTDAPRQLFFNKQRWRCKNGKQSDPNQLSFEWTSPITPAGFSTSPPSKIHLIICPGTVCEPDGSPGLNLKLREERTREWAKLFPQAIVVASGGHRGVRKYRETNPRATEAIQIVKHLVDLGIPSCRILIDSHSEESRGNLIIPISAFAVPLRLQHVLVVSQFWHCVEMANVAGYVCPRKIVVDFDPLPCALDSATRQARIASHILYGSRFLSAMRRAIRPGALEHAFSWTKLNHRDRPYRGLSFGRIMRDLKPQLAYLKRRSPGGQRLGSRW